MKSLLTLHLSVLSNLGRTCSIDITRDTKSITGRYEEEGDSYLTITLPKLAKALEKGLDTGLWPAHDVSSVWKHTGGLPVFMRGFLSRIFDVNGSLVANPDIDCIWAIRQMCYLSHKVEKACSPERERSAFADFVATDRELAGLPGRIDPARLERYVRVAHRLFGSVFQECDRKIASWELIPKHGPGAVAERLSQKDKRSYSYWTDRLATVFPYWRYTANSLYREGPVPVPINEELPVRVVSVPKTQSTPRIIAIEPSSVQYAQQGLKRELYELIGRGPLSGVLGFSDQTRNQRLAKESSSSQRLATLDLSEASDRIHWYLIYRMLERYPHLWDFVSATRSSRADVPFEGVIPLQKFASMGSALTFPLEAIVFTTLAVCGLEQTENRRLHTRNILGDVSVYGDDIIVPVHAVDSVVDWLEHFGAKVNRSKSFWTGKFRESCGAEYYDGHDVTVVRARSELPSSRNDAAGVAAFVDLRNRALQHGLWGLVRDIDESLESLISLPYSSATSERAAGLISRSTFLPISRIGTSWNANLQRDEVKVPYLAPISGSYRIDDEEGLLEWFHDALRRGDLVDRYTSQERAASFSIKRRWACFTTIV